MRALLIANANDTDAGFVGERFRSRGYAFDECHREHPGDWPSLDGHELVVMLGSEWSVYWPEVADNVSAEVAVVHEAARRGVPIFGICFGNQVLAHALGGTVERAREPEIGWMNVVSDLPLTIAEGPWMQWHYDVVTVPGRATEVASAVDVQFCEPAQVRHDILHALEATAGVLLGHEGRVEQLAAGIIQDGDEVPLAELTPEPSVFAAVHVQHHAAHRSSFAALAVLTASSTDLCQTRLLQQ